MGRARDEPRHLDAYLSSLKNHPHPLEDSISASMILLRPPLTRLVHALRYNECITRYYQPAINRGAGARTKVPTRRVANITGLLLCIGDKALIKGTAGFAVGVCRPFFLFLIFNF